jgi:hypothetical protein
VWERNKTIDLGRIPDEVASTYNNQPSGEGILVSDAKTSF